MGLKVGILGAGAFASQFIGLFQAHPDVSEVSIAEEVPERRAAAAARFDIERTFESSEPLLDSDVDAIAIFTQNWLHGPQARDALLAGKHAYCAVPMGVSLEELTGIIAAAEKSGTVYMMGETSYYYSSALFCRMRRAEGAFGTIVYCEAEYLHDMSYGLYEVFQRRGREHWREQASFPPMYYPSHSVGLVLSVINSPMVSVSCHGYRDDGDDGIFDSDVSAWNNAFSNECALFRCADGTIVRVNEMRRIGVGEAVRLGVWGTEGIFEEGGGRSFWTRKSGPWSDVTEALQVSEADLTPSTADSRPLGGVAAIHDLSRLPPGLRGISTGHQGSHPYLVDDFIRACVHGSEPPVGPRVAASYCAPGLVAHESALKDGDLLPIPDFLSSQ